MLKAMADQRRETWQIVAKSDDRMGWLQVRPPGQTRSLVSSAGTPFHLSIINESFVPGGDCHLDGCGRKTAKRCMVNFNDGYVVEVDLCEDCASKWDGADSFLLKTVKK